VLRRKGSTRKACGTGLSLSGPLWDTVREVIHRFNELGMRALNPRWAGGRPRRISAEDEAFLVATATTRPEKLGRLFTHWSLRKLVDHLADNPVRIVRIGRERARQLLAAHEITFHRTKTWKESPDPQRETKLARIEQVVAEHPDRTFAFDEFGPLACAPPPAPDGRRRGTRSGCRRTTTNSRGCGTSTAATPSRRTGCVNNNEEGRRFAARHRRLGELRGRQRARVDLPGSLRDGGRGDAVSRLRCGTDLPQRCGDFVREGWRAPVSGGRSRRPGR
jgi:transposase